MLRNAQIKTSRSEVNGSSGHLGANGGGNGADVVSGRGLAHRPATARLALGVDMATGAKRLDPSLGQIAAACRITHTRLRKAIRAAAKNRLRAIVDTVGLNNAFDLLSEIEVQLHCEDTGLDAN
jgi:hypothetical protein